MEILFNERCPFSGESEMNDNNIEVTLGGNDIDNCLV
jgi:hypothetical protein